MQDLNDKITGGDLTAAEWNQVPSEIQNVIEGLGQTLSAGDLNQLGKGIAGYVANGIFYADTGLANAYVLAVIGAKQSGTAYTDGFKAVFRAGNASTGASTVNVAGLGVKNIFFDGAALIGGEIVSGSLVTLIYDLANGRFDLIPELSNIYADGTNIGIGARVQLAKLHVQTTTAGSPSVSADADEGAFESSGNTGISIWGGISGLASIHMGDNGLTTIGRIVYDNSTEEMGFYAGSTKRMAIDQGLIVGAPTGGDKGAGTANVESLYIDGVIAGSLESVSGAVTTGTINTGTSGSVDVAHGLGTDDVFVVVSCEPISDALTTNCDFGWYRVDGKSCKMLLEQSGGVSSAAAITAPSTGNIRFFVHNKHVGRNSTFTFQYKIFVA